MEGGNGGANMSEMGTRGLVASLLNEREEKVFNALKTLPEGFELRFGEALWPSGQGPICERSYAPKFEVVAPDGRIVALEALSYTSFSIINFVKLLAIDKGIRGRGRGFLVLVLGEKEHRLHSEYMPEFSSLHIQPVKTDAEIIRAVLAEFADMETQALSNLYTR